MKNNYQQKKVYLAGPDVFEQDAIQRGQEYVKAAERRNLIGLYPLDNEISQDHERPDYEIYRLNKELLDAADYVVANLSDFRGYEPDSGTVWEVAYAIAKNKIVIGYIDNNDSILNRIQKQESVYQKGSEYLDKQGRYIENFGNQLNLMLQHSLHLLVHGTIEKALDEVKKHIEKINQTQHD